MVKQKIFIALFLLAILAPFLNGGMSSLVSLPFFIILGLPAVVWFSIKTLFAKNKK